MAVDFAPHNMTTDSAPSPYVASGSAEFSPFLAYKMFDNGVGIGQYALCTGAGVCTFGLDTGSGNSYILLSYSIQVNSIPEPARAPKTWTMQGSNDNSTWTTVDTVSSETGWGSAETRTYTCDVTTTAYRYFRLNITANNGDGTFTQIGELSLFADVPRQVSSIGPSEAWGSPTITGTLFPDGIGSGETWGTPAINTADLTANGIASAEAWGSPEVLHGNVTSPSGIVSAEAWGTFARKFTLSPSPAQLVLHPIFPVLSLVRKTAAGTQVIIGDVSYGLWRANTFKIDRNLSSGTTASFELEYYGGPRPKRRQEVSLFIDSIKRFGGIIQSVNERSRPGHPDQSILTVNCSGYEAYTSRRIVAELYTLALGGVAGIIMYQLWFKYLQIFGVTKVGDNGPLTGLPDQLFHYITLTEALNTVRDQAPGWDWWIDDNKVFHFDNTDSGTTNAPFAISRSSSAESADASTGLNTTETDINYRNRQFVLSSNDLQVLRVEIYTGDGVTTAFYTQYVQSEPPLVRVNGAEKKVTQLGDWVAGWQAYYVPGGIGVFFSPDNIPGAGAVVDIEYRNPFPLAAVAEDAAAIAAQGLYESIVHEKNIVDFGTATQEAQGLLTLYNDSNTKPQQLSYSYSSAQQPEWLTPGMQINVNWTRPDVSAVAVVEQVSSQETGLRLWRHNITLRIGPGNMTEDQALAKVNLNSQRNPIISPPLRITIEPDIDGVGLKVGDLPSKNRYVFQENGVFDYWQTLFATDPPTGSDAIIDAKLNGTSIFPGGKKMLAKDGLTGVWSGIQFISPNLAFKKDDILSFHVDQIGATTPGKFGVFYIGVKYNPTT